MGGSVVYPIGIFGVALIVAFFLLDLSWDSFFIHKKKLLISFLVFCVPCLIGCPIPSTLLESGFAVTIITDIYECSVFSIIPLILFLWRQLFLLCIGDYLLLWNNFFYVFCVVGIYYSITTLSQKLFKKEGIGRGDMYFIAALSSYIDPMRILFVFFLASFLGVCYGVLYFLFFRRSLDGLPFIPFVYIGASLVQYDAIYFILYAFFLN
jgi:prepilin signal peptidase PulO-like enzyme (type II secretory pathway)